MPETTHDLGPYARTARAYTAAGWPGALPLPHGAKWPPPKGFTGAEGIDPSAADVLAWCEGDEGAGNIGIRLPLDVVGVDVDNYDGKLGAATFAAAQRRLGPLPPTWRVSARPDPISGIRLYRVAPGLAWPGELGPGVEIIQYRHRYAVTWPSVHPSGGLYRWTTPDGLTSLGAVPVRAELPWLPSAWVADLTGGHLATATMRAGLDSAGVSGWLAEHGGGQPCRVMAAWSAKAEAGLRDPGHGSRHDLALHASRRLTQLVADGHTGALAALAAYHGVWLAEAEGDASRITDPGEWARIVSGAVDQAAAGRLPAELDPCAYPFAGLLPPTSWPSASVEPVVSATATVTPQANAEAVPSATGRPARSSWWPRDLADVLAGTDHEPPPQFLTRLDGVALLYVGKTNGLIGESESGKSWVAQMASAQALAAGHHVTYLDFEDTAPGVVARMRLLGASDAELIERFHYVGPDEALTVAASGDLHEHLARHAPGLIVLDGFNAAMTLLGLDLMSNTDATKFAQMLLRPLSDTGACVTYVDHIPKAKDSETKGGIGAQAKRAMTTGTILKVEVVTPFGRGEAGRIKLTVDKDRGGHVRGNSGAAQIAGFATITPLDSELIGMAIEAPEAATGEPSKPFRPTVLMGRVSAFLALQPDRQAMSANVIEKGVTGNDKHKRQAVTVLVSEGYIELTRHGQSTIHTLVRPFVEAADGLIEPNLGQPRPTSANNLGQDPSDNLGQGPLSLRVGPRLAGLTTEPEIDLPRPTRPNRNVAYIGTKLTDLDTGEVIIDRATIGETPTDG